MDVWITWHYLWRNHGNWHYVEPDDGSLAVGDFRKKISGVHAIKDESPPDVIWGR
jgi:hypothetical protein